MYNLDLDTTFLGRNYKYFEEIDSTQEEIFRQIYSNSIKNGTLVFADIQTKGKGTHGRTWHTDDKGNIAFSIYIETNCLFRKIDGITVDIAKIIVDIFKEDYDINIDIKEPNDLIINGKKIGGILTESKINKEIVKYLVIGIGINTVKEEFSIDIKDIASSIKKEFSVIIDRKKFLEKFCLRLENNLIQRNIYILD